MKKKNVNSTSALKVMEERDINKVSSSQKVAKVFGQIGVYAFLGIMALIVLFPFYFMITDLQFLHLFLRHGNSRTIPISLSLTSGQRQTDGLEP